MIFFEISRSEKFSKISKLLDLISFFVIHIMYSIKIYQWLMKIWILIFRIKFQIVIITFDRNGFGRFFYRYKSLYIWWLTYIFFRQFGEGRFRGSERTVSDNLNFHFFFNLCLILRLKKFKTLLKRMGYILIY